MDVRRIALGAARRAKRPLPGGPRIRTVPFGISRGIRVESDLHGLAYLPLGLYEHEIHRWIRRFIRVPDGPAYDIGAAGGVYALAIASRTQTPVYAFERDSDALETLRRNFDANPDTARIVVVVRSWVGQHTTDDTVSLDDWIYRDGRPAPAFVKIDVEGAELDVLRGARRLLAERRPHLIIETHSYRLESDCRQTLLAAGYQPKVVRRRRWLREDRPGTHNRWLVAAGS